MANRWGKDYVKQTIEEKRARWRKHYAENIDNINARRAPGREERNAKARQRRLDNPEKAKSISLKRCFGIDLIQYNKMLAEQNGCCAICGRHKSELKRNFSVDHNHDTNEIRGLLCQSCNHGLGCFRSDDGLELLCSAISYLKNNDKLWRTG